MGCKRGLLKDGATREELEKVREEIRASLDKIGRDYPKFKGSMSFPDVHIDLAADNIVDCNLEGVLRNMGMVGGSSASFTASEITVREVGEVARKLTEEILKHTGQSVKGTTREMVDVNRFSADYARFLNESYKKVADLYNNHCECIREEETEAGKMRI